MTINPTLPLIPTSAERMLLLRLSPATWRPAAQQRELSGVDVDSADLTETGIVTMLRLTGKWTVAKLKTSDELVRAALMLPTSVRMTIRAGDIGGTAELVIRTRSPLDGVSLAWMPGRRGIGRDTVTGSVVEISPYGHWMLAGATGMGKSVLLRPLMAKVMERDDAALVYIDPKRQEFSLWQGKIRVACEPDDIYALTRELIRELDYRQQHSVGATWRPTPEHPELVVIVDEGASLVRQSKDKEFRDLLKLYEKIATMGRAARLWLIWCTQYPTKTDGIPAQVVEMMLNRISLYVDSPLTDRVIFGERAQRDGWEPSQLSGIPGEALIRANGRKPDPVRVWFMDDDEVRLLPPGIVWEGPAPADETDQPDPLHRGAWMGQAGPWYAAPGPQRAAARPSGGGMGSSPVRPQRVAARPVRASTPPPPVRYRRGQPPTPDFGPRHRAGAGRLERALDWLRPW